MAPASNVLGIKVVKMNIRFGLTVGRKEKECRDDLSDATTGMPNGERKNRC